MPLFDTPVKPELLWPRDARWPVRRARRLIARFQEQWPELIYEMDLDVELANAQAFLSHGRRCIRLFGGLVRHRRIGQEGLAVTLAHETGHHLGGTPFMPYFRWLSSEERADEWAETVGLPSLFAASERVLIVGNRQLAAVSTASVSPDSNF